MTAALPFPLAVLLLIIRLGSLKRNHIPPRKEKMQKSSAVGQDAAITQQLRAGLVCCCPTSSVFHNAGRKGRTGPPNGGVGQLIHFEYSLRIKKTTNKQPIYTGDYSSNAEHQLLGSTPKREGTSPTEHLPSWVSTGHAAHVLFHCSQRE